MKYILTYELLKTKYSTKARSSKLDKDKVVDAFKRKIRFAKDYLTKSDKLQFDRFVIDEEKLVNNIHDIIKNFTKLHSFFGDFRYRKVNGIFCDFLSYYNELVTKFGYYPTNITENLMKTIFATNQSLTDTYGGWISDSEEAKQIYHDTQKLIESIKKLYYDFEDEVKKYNL